jgi:hypothetical protein
MIRHARTYLVLSLIVGATQAAGCVGAEENSSEDDSALTTADVSKENIPTVTFEAAGLSEPVPGAHCPKKPFTLSLIGANQESSSASPVKTATSCPVDLYFHPNNGVHGGWIESWRLCNQGGQDYVICTGGSAPVRYYNPSSCNGTVQDYFPQGWHGWAQTGGGCC